MAEPYASAMDPFFRKLFDGDIDWEGIEGARGQVRVSDVPSIVTYYQGLGDWPQKVGVIQLVQDQSDRALEPIMLDVLRAPATNTWLDDTIELTKAVALGFLSEAHDRFMHYYNDRAALRADVAAFLESRGLAVESATPAPRRAPAPVGESAEARMRDAIERGDVAAVVALLDEWPIDQQLSHPKLGPETAPPLIYALMKRQPAVTQALLDRGASVSLTRPGGQSALWWAASEGDAAMVAALIAKGADPNVCDRFGGSPLHQAVRGGAAAVKVLLDAGAKMDAPYQDGRTPLWFAAYEGRKDVVELLLDRGSPIDQLHAGKAVLHLATQENHATLVDALLARGATVDLPTAEGLTPLMISAQRGYPRVVSRLIEAGADPEVRAESGRHAGKTAAELATGKRAEKVRAALSRG